MKKKSIKLIARQLGLLFLGAFAFISCEKENDQVPQSQQEKMMDGKVNLLDPGRYGCAPLSSEYLKSIRFLTPEEYKSKIAILRTDLSSVEQKQQVINAVVPSSFTLPAEPIGDQGTEGSCVGWGVGYAAHGITRYINNSVHQYNWSGAARSASYLYNQIKISDCGSGSYPNDAMNLIKNQGECSNIQMTYVDGGCYTQPTAQQKTWAAARKSSGWFNVSPTNVSDIKYYLSQNYPVAACFDVNQSFYDMRYNNYVWSTLGGTRQGGHCVCIVGYNDATQQFKVQNSWGSSWGKSGYFYVTYTNITRGAFNWMGSILPNTSIASNQPQ